MRFCRGLTFGPKSANNHRLRKSENGSGKELIGHAIGNIASCHLAIVSGG